MRRFTVLSAVLALTVGLVPGASQAAGPCTGSVPAGGDWPMYGRDLAGTRNQAAPTTLDVSTVGSLRRVWATPSSMNAGTSTAVVSGNCLYFAGAGSITALDVVTGQVHWRKEAAPAYQTKRAINALVVANGRVYANVSEADGSQAPGAGPVGVALDADTGAPVYVSEPINFGQPTTAVAGAVVFGNQQLVVTNGGDGVPNARPGYALLDATTGAIKHSQTTIPAADLDNGYAGGGQWATPVVDVESGYAFNGTANPYSKLKEHRFDNAILKIDVDPARDGTYGTITDAYKGETDQYVEGLHRQVLCDELGEEIGYHPCCNFSVTCVQLDIDFGGSPTMFRNKAGELLVGELQKSGVFHVVYAATMQVAWKAILATPPPGTAGNAASAANDGERVYVAANPGVLHALDPETGRLLWSAPIGDGVSYHPVSVANGVVYVIGNHGTLMAFDARTGLPLLAAPLAADGGRLCSTLAGGVTVAANTVFANCDGMIVAYRLP